MADEAAKDAAAKARIIKHLNADHQRSLSYYLQHYNSLSSIEARKPVLTDITFNALTFRTAWGTTPTIPLYPPMKSWSEARTRTVEMDRESRKALDISHIALTHYVPPNNAWQIIVFGLCLFTFTVFLTSGWIVEGTFFYDKVLPWFPGGPEWFLWTQSMLLLPVVAIHLTESFLLDRKKLRKYGVERGTLLWCKWIASCFIEGRGCFVRINEVVAQKELEAEKQKH